MGGGGGEEFADAVLPGAVLDSVTETLQCVDELKKSLESFLELAEPEVLAELPPLQQARAFFVLATSAAVLFSARLRCSGIRADGHSIRTEFERLELHEAKLRKFNDWSKAPLRPSTKINPQAATRFIEHSLPDLTLEQRKSMREISRGKGNQCRSFPSQRVKKKSKHQSSESQSLHAAAQEFLEKAAKELFGSNNSGVKGPCRDLASDDGNTE
ncbi:hypothetical protein AXF42_Ash018583 [Apostasia shenzhenica]|uniref:Nuclear nucleic acid-binding protein C1D n=1 Tax=Apostasia shenzhenica TaxID=1088818 RepID=A0A2I0APZ6_9ASPA|nr:hypothetical protein AXF42_Ash018583 [Apostasia shenzhenica]